LIGVIAGVLILTAPVEDDGLILKNVFAAGVNLGGMTPEQAKNALHAATDNTYTEIPLVIHVEDTEIQLTPKKTCAKLDVDAVVDAAYNYGRTGSRAERQRARNHALISSYHVPIITHLGLNTGYIQQEVNNLGALYSTTLSQPSFYAEGARPSMEAEDKDTSIIHQVLHIKLGTAEYGMSTSALYQQIMDAYNSNLFQVVGECSVIAPKPVDCDAIFAQHCISPIDAGFNADTFEVTPEVYGYGFILDDLKRMVAEAKYGDELRIPLTFIKPRLTAEEISGDLFQDIMGVYKTALSADNNRNKNLTLACKAINNIIVKSGDTFSFNKTVGQPTLSKGYKNVGIYVGTEITNVLGGGISQVASTLYQCVLMADLEVVERINHSYVPDFAEPGLDVDIQYNVLDFQFTNNTEYPIRIEAAIVDGYVQIQLLGTDTRAYRVEIKHEITTTRIPSILIQTMRPGNGYNDGDILVAPITGYTITTYRYTYLKLDENGNPIIPEEGLPEQPTNPDDPNAEPVDWLSKNVIAQSFYDKRNQIVVQIEDAPVITPDPTVPPDPVIPSDPTDTTDPSEPSGAVDPSAPSIPSDVNDSTVGEA